MSLALARHTRNGECWYGVSAEPTSVHTFVEYSWRLEIEENFLADKSNGFQFESSLVRTAEAVARLCLVLAVTPLYLVAQGTQVVAGHKAARRYVEFFTLISTTPRRGGPIISPGTNFFGGAGGTG